MKFKNKKTGAILVPNTKFVEEQMTKSDLYEIVGEKAKEPTVAEIKAKLEDLGIDYAGKTKREDLIALLPEE